MLTTVARLGAGAATLVVALSMSGCAMFFPSRPISDDVHLRNSPDGVELMFCTSADLEPQVIGRSVSGSGSDLFPLSPVPVPVRAGDTVPLDSLTSLPEGSGSLAPLGVGERLSVSVVVDSGERRPLQTALFEITQEVLDGFDRGAWLTPAGVLQIAPCGP
jgi:hypothetical protein